MSCLPLTSLPAIYFKFHIDARTYTLLYVKNQCFQRIHSSLMLCPGIYPDFNKSHPDRVDSIHILLNLCLVSSINGGIRLSPTHARVLLGVFSTQARAKSRFHPITTIKFWESHFFIIPRHIRKSLEVHQHTRKVSIFERSSFTWIDS